MSISTYAELKTAVSNWLHRADLSAYLDDFVTIAESRIAREVRAQIQEQRTTAAASTSSPYINLPSDFIEHRALWVSANPISKLEYLAPEAFFERYPITSITGKPVAYTVIGDEVRLGPSPDSAYTLELWYWKRLTALSSAVNTLFTNNPDLYLYASLCAALPFLKDDKRVPIWELQFTTTRDHVNNAEKAKCYPTGLRIQVSS